MVSLSAGTDTRRPIPCQSHNFHLVRRASASRHGGETELAAQAALIDKLRQTQLGSEVPARITKAQERETRDALGLDGREIEGAKRAKYPKEKGMLLRDWAQEWQNDWMRIVQDSTKSIYFGHIERYILPYLGDYHLNELTARVLKTKWWDPITELRKEVGGIETDEPRLKNSAKANIYKTLSILLSSAHSKMGTLFALPLIEVPKHSRPETDREVKAATKRLRKIFIDEPDRDDPRWSLFALSLMGLRQAERLALKVSDIDLEDEDGPLIYIHNQLDFSKAHGGWYLKNRLKNGKPRELPLYGVFLDAVQRQLEWRKEWSSRPDWNPDPKFADLLYLQEGGKLWTRRQDAPAWKEFVGPGIRGHLARHITGHILAEDGIGNETAKLLLGHKSDAWASYYRIADASIARRELLNAERRAAGQATIHDIGSGRRRA